MPLFINCVPSAVSIDMYYHPVNKYGLGTVSHLVGFLTSDSETHQMRRLTSNPAVLPDFPFTIPISACPPAVYREQQCQRIYPRYLPWSA